MVAEEADCRRHLQSHDYFEALGLDSSATSPQIIRRIVELRMRYPDLSNLLAAAQRALTGDREEYLQTRSQVDETLRTLREHHGPYVDDLLDRAEIDLFDVVTDLRKARHAPHPSVPPELLDALPPEMRERLAEIAGRNGTRLDPVAIVAQQVEQLVDTLPSVDVEEAEVRAGRAERISHPVGECECGGTGRQRCPRTREVVFEIPPHVHARTILRAMAPHDGEYPLARPGLTDGKAPGQPRARVGARKAGRGAAADSARLGFFASLGLSLVAMVLWVVWTVSVDEWLGGDGIGSVWGGVAYLAPAVVAAFGASVLRHVRWLSVLLLAVALAPMAIGLIQLLVTTVGGVGPGIAVALLVASLSGVAQLARVVCAAWRKRAG